MKDNILMSFDGIEIYQNEIDILCDEYISDLPENVVITKPSVFSGLLKYIYKYKIKYIIETDKQNRNNHYNNNYELLNDIFENIYISLCSKYMITPTIIQFCVFTGIDRSVLCDLRSGVYRANGYKVNEVSKRTVQKWFDYCESVSLGEATRGSIGDIFNLKANYGYRDNVLPETPQPITTTQATPEQIADRRAARIPEKPQFSVENEID